MALPSYRADAVTMPAAARVGRYRWIICGLLFLAATINYVDRQVIGILKPTLQSQFGWTEIDYGDIVFAFQLAYAIGVADPVSVMVHTEGTGRIPEEKITELVRQQFKLTPRGIMEELDLRRPIYKKTAAFGHFGRSESEFSWEKTDKAAALRTAAGAGV